MSGHFSQHTRKTRFLSFLLAFAMLVTALPTVVLPQAKAADAGDIQLTQTVTPVQGSDDTYQTTLGVNGVDIDIKNPVDVILAIDISNSMNNAVDNITITKNAAKSFINTVMAKNDADEATNVRVSLVTYGSYGYAYNFGATGEWTDQWSRYTTSLSSGTYYTSDASKALAVLENANFAPQKISGKGPEGTLVNDSGGTNTVGGFLTCQAVANTRNKPAAQSFVVFMTDGVPTFRMNTDGTLLGTGSSTTPDDFNAAVTAGNALKTAGNTVYTIGLLTNYASDEMRLQMANHLLSAEHSYTMSTNGSDFEYTEGGAAYSDEYTPITDPDTAGDQILEAYATIAKKVAALAVGTLRIVVNKDFTLTEASRQELTSKGYTLTSNPDGTVTIDIPNVKASTEPFTLTFTTTVNNTAAGVLQPFSPVYQYTLYDNTTGQKSFPQAIIYRDPKAVDDQANGKADTAIVIDAQANDNNRIVSVDGFTVDGPNIVDLSAVSGPGTATATVSEGKISFTANKRGTYTFTYKNQLIATRTANDSKETRNSNAATVTVVVTEDPHTVSFDLNGGTGTTPTSVTDYAGETVPLPNQSGFSRAHYDFVGWATSRTATTALRSYTMPTSDTTLYAVWEEHTKYTVTFDLNGGTGTKPANVTNYAGETVPLPAQGDITRAHYDFLGWATSRTASTALRSYEMPAGNTTLYAVWKEHPKFTVIFDLNGGTGTKPANITNYAGETVPLPAQGSITRAHYNFLGWATSSTATAPLAGYEMPARDTTLYAVWEEHPKFTVTFDLNGGAGTAPASVTNYAGETVPLPAQGNITRAHYDFLGWAASSTATTPLTAYEMPSRNTTLYAVWKEHTKYTVTFDLNGGTGTKPANVTNYAGETVPLPAQGDITRAHYDFLGWAASSTATTPLTSYEMPSRNTTLYAVWREHAKYTVTFDLNGGTGTKPASVTNYAEQAVPLPMQGNITRAHYDFLGWATSSAATSALTSYEMPARDTTLYAVWKEHPKFTITFDLNGGTGTLPASITNYAGQAVPLPAQGDITRAHYDFLGWATVSNATTPLASYEMPNYNTKLYAVWKEHAKYTVTFDLNGGTGTPPMSVTNYAGEAVTLPAIGDITRPHYTFLGWAATADATSALTSYEMPARDTTLYAVWQEHPKYTVGFDLNGGTGTTPTSVTNYAGTAVMLPTQGDIVRAHYDFLGWALTRDATEVLSAYDIPTGDVTLYAVWKEHPKFTVAFDLNGGTGTTPTSVTDYAKTAVTLPSDKSTDAEGKETTLFSRDHYAFLGWAATKDATEVLQAYEIPESNATLYAIWKEDAKYTVTFDLNGGTGTAPTSVTDYAKTAVTLPSDKSTDAEGKETTLFSRDNSTFLGWAATKDATEVLKTYEIPAGNATLYAIWKEDARYTVSFDLNGGTGTKPASVTGYSGTAVTLPARGDLAYTHHTFVGWALTNSATTALTSYAISSQNTTLYAVWKEDAKYTVTFDTNGGTGTAPDKITDYSGAAVTLPDQGNMTRENYTFTGWSTSATSNTVLTSYVMPSKDSTLYAVWAPKLNTQDHMAYMVGYTNNTFRPASNITRAEVVVMFSRLLQNAIDTDKSYNTTFSDVKSGQWFANAIGYMEQYGIVKGYNDGTFRPNKAVSRAEFATIASRFDRLTTGEGKRFNDVPSTHWAYEYINFAATKGWVEGYQDGSFKPDQPITREAVVTIVNRMLGRSADESYVKTHTSQLAIYPDVDNTRWSYYDIIEATNGHLYTKDSAGKETWTSLKK